jgi:hypothetical protein
LVQIVAVKRQVEAVGKVMGKKATVKKVKETDLVSAAMDLTMNFSLLKSTRDVNSLKMKECCL